jgi:hypothetical protein
MRNDYRSVAPTGLSCADALPRRVAHRSITPVLPPFSAICAPVLSALRPGCLSFASDTVRTVLVTAKPTQQFLILEEKTSFADLMQSTQATTRSGREGFSRLSAEDKRPCRQFLHDDVMFKSFPESSSIFTLAAARAVNQCQAERGRVAMYSTPSCYGMGF